MKLMEAKKKKSKLSPVEKDAKESVLRGLSDEMGGLMKKKLGGIKKATIMADSPEGMKKGAELVQKIAGSMPDGEEKEKHGMMRHGMKHSSEEEMSDESEQEGEEVAEEEEETSEEMSKEELLAEIERLKAKIEKLS